MLEKTTRVNYLFDFYQQLLTDKQRNYMELYYLEDYSLGEISETYDVSRQAVYDNIRRTEAMLEEYEAQLGLYERFEKRNEIIQEMKEKLSQRQLEDVETLLVQLENLE
ncbi:putative DNA-binding protein [Alkalibacillus haloalkaliphilus]|uniref:putative DNA-binding protein n=1 Tax=Alkalibacillus haloalkaliphilus TaxID=94136 RepID=UPI0029364BB5|nr:putative DNA-binding protein [Alkalibacillus haloalkaliphilus]MDV2580572.1 putative DNA-binding protein [Alkalibacillus haloalkaliphilus]